MACKRIAIPSHDGTVAVGIICGLPRPKPCSCCGRPADRLCDWLVGATTRGKRKDCDRPVCSACSTSPAPDKDLCREHGEVWAARLAAAVMLEPVRS